MYYSSIEEIQAANRGAGHTWFGPDEMAFFGTTVVSDVLAGRFFVTRDERGPNVDGYTVREAGPDGDVHTVGEYQGHASREDAINAVRTLVLHRTLSSPGAP